MSAYLYRLDVTYPEGSREYGWEPEGWKGYPPHWDGDGTVGPFWWPAVRNFLSKRAAEKRAKLLESYGAKVTVVRSLPVQWPDPQREGVQR